MNDQPTSALEEAVAVLTGASVAYLLIRVGWHFLGLGG